MPTDKYLITEAENEYVNAATDIWNLFSNNGAGDGGGLVAIEDIGNFDAFSGNLTLAGAFTSVGLNMLNWASGKELNLSTYDMTINGEIEALGGSGEVAGPGTIIVTGTGQHSIKDEATIDNTVILKFTASSGTPTLIPVNVAFPIIGGLTIDNNGVTSFIVGASTTGLRIAGDFIHTAGKIDFLTNTVAVRMTGASVDISGPDAANKFHSLTIATGATVTRQVDVYARSLVVEAGAVLAASNVDQQTQLVPIEDDFLSVAGNVTTAAIRVTILNSQSNALDVSGVVNLELIGFDDIYTWTGLLEVLALRIASGQDNKYTKLALSGSGHSLGNVILGQVGKPLRPGRLALLGGSSLAIASLTRGDAGDSSSEFNLGSSNLESSGVLNFTGIAGIVDGAAYIIGGTVSNLDSQRITGGVLHCFGTVNGGNNTNAIAAGEVTFDQHTPPGSLARMGVGI